MTNLGRRPLQIVEIDVDYCTRTYGAGGCTAALGADGVRKCYNTFFTCQDRANFDQGHLTLRFAQNNTGLPKGQTIFPALESVSTNPTMITLAAVDDRTGSLGKRARVTVRLRDFAYTDALTDKYASERRSGAAQTDEPGYAPEDRGTFFGKLRRRAPYYFGRALRVRNGKVGDDISTMPTEHYVITEWKGPDAAGTVEFTAQDPLKLTDEKYALCPKPNSGKIPGDVDEVAMPTFSLEPAGIGAEYDVSGRARVGSEIVGFTRSGDDITVTGRGLGGSTAEAHSAGDTFQQCYVVQDALPENVIGDLLENYSGVPSSWVDVLAWGAEISRWAANLRFTRVVSEPTPVLTLLGQIMDVGFVLWSDPLAGKIRLRANRPIDVDEVAPAISDDASIIEGTLARSDLDAQRLTQVWAIHTVINFAESQTNSDNYKVAEVPADLEAEGPNEYAQKKFHKIYMPWLGRFPNAAQANLIADRLLTRYRDTPQELSFAVDIKDKGDLGIASLIEVTSRVLQDETGHSSPTAMQVVKVDEQSPGNRMVVTAQSHKFEGRWGWVMSSGYTTAYDAATAESIAKGCFMMDHPTTSTFPDGTGPYIMF